ncbi:alpha/beta fold hydrolase [Mastigocoleus testarum]|uniref:Cholesterol oxidase n=1 Tax=Mastigocoleus testarum BC008 TaxID=371196 RepID=A0A0V7ZQ18_9CYAN|nr:alpha/beta fold hydrolase [Mastigocoleus testarum]KST66741.1 choline dehydrogenase [Mastigocoleus testarum BC008]
MTRLSNPIERIQNHYKVVVIGSGYGGGITASRLARAGQQVCILERGKEIQPGEFPNNPKTAFKEMQIDLEGKHIGPSTGLYDFRINEDINVFVGCGLGGTSLINANVSLRPEDRVFRDKCFPQEFRNDVRTLLAQGYNRAEEMLKPTPYPENYPPLKKLEALEKSAQYLNQPFERPPINVNFEDGINHVGVEQQACNLCGDCVSGCNYKAKNTVAMNYLPDAKNHGAEIYTQVSVSWIQKQDNRWLIHYQLLENGRETFDAPTMFVSADIVILAAGALGSTEILLRSASHGLPLSKKLGHGFSGNGDVLAFGYNNEEEINGVGFGYFPPQKMEDVGPCITGIIDMRSQPRLDNSIIIQEGSIPGALSGFLPRMFAAVAPILTKDIDSGLVESLKEKGRELNCFVRGAYTGALKNTQTFLVMSHDEANGRIFLSEDKLRIHWQGIGQKTHFERVDDYIGQATRALGGTKIHNPIWSNLFQKDLITVHPLGGCPMGEDASCGVVNHKGQVFSQTQGKEVYQGLYVCDGSVIPRSLGVNPLLTISAIAERCAALIAQDYGWKINYNLPSQTFKSKSKNQIASSLQRPGIKFTETMRGYFSTQEKEDYKVAAAKGKENNSSLEFTLTISSSDLEQMLNLESHSAKVVGTVIAPELEPKPITVRDGDFRLFVVNSNDSVKTKRMEYFLKAIAESGKIYNLEGYKLIHDDGVLDLWSDTTTLYISIYECDTFKRSLVGKGILNIHLQDFLRQMSTLRITNAKNIKQYLQLTTRFGRFFAGELFDIYGKIFTRPTVFNPDAPPRQKRKLRVDAPQIHYFEARDGAQLRLTNYHGGNKGPVMLVHGFGVSSSIFSIDTIGTNLVEYLFEHGYDIWLLDYRVSIELPISSTQSNGDDIALNDFPAAVEKISNLTGAKSIQVVAHCFGATTFFMSMLAGLEGVRSAVISQVATHMRSPMITKINSHLRLPSLLKKLGFKSLTAYSDLKANCINRIIDTALKLYPVKAGKVDTNPISHRISFLYGQLYNLEQLNDATYKNLHELFGIANLSTFEHLALLVRECHLVSADSSEIYVGQLENLAIPITFIHGEENNCWLPESTEYTCKLLSDVNGKQLYKRYVIPNYGHIDCIFGKNAVNDVYPLILEQLEETL